MRSNSKLFVEPDRAVPVWLLVSLHKENFGLQRHIEGLTLCVRDCQLHVDLFRYYAVLS